MVKSILQCLWVLHSPNLQQLFILTWSTDAMWWSVSLTYISRFSIPITWSHHTKIFTFDLHHIVASKGDHNFLNLFWFKKSHGRDEVQSPSKKESRQVWLYGNLESVPNCIHKVLENARKRYSWTMRTTMSFKGSSKGMEADMASTIISRVKEDGYEVGTLHADNDSSTYSRLQAEHRSIEKKDDKS